MNNNKNLTNNEVFSLAVKNHQEGKTDIALKLYNEILKIDPNQSQVLNNLGIIYADLGENQKAIGCYEKLTKNNPNFADAHNNLGVVFKTLGENQKAKECYEKAIAIKPDYADAHNNLGLIYADLGENQKAKSCYEKAIAINPNNADAHNNLGNIFKELGENKIAKSCYEKAIAIKPNYALAYGNLGAIFFLLGENQKSIGCYEKAIAINPNYANAHNNLANIYVSQLTDFEIAISKSNEALKIYQKNHKFFDQSVSLFKLKHDVEQANYLSSKNYKINDIDTFIKIGGEILKREENKDENNNFNKKILLSDNEINTLLLYSKENHTYQTKTITGSCINLNKNWSNVEDEYLNSTNQIMYIDNFLSDEALIELREFCLVSKVWHKEYHNKYLGAFSNTGFISPIHLQIAVDLQQQLPKIFGAHKLGKFWGFKYDSSLGKGINIHADDAIHNLNFWITPDEYNNDKNSGGLKVYDLPAPDNWSFKDYNASTREMIYKFLKENNANCTNVPYKYNRAVLFNSAYFHETDEIDFKDEYVGRRINNTYLFGTRLVK